jgi:hypothetical protein
MATVVDELHVVDDVMKWESQLNAAETFSTEAMLTIIARQRLSGLGIAYYTLGFACTNARKTREALLKAIRQVDEEIQDVYLPRQALMQFADDFMED